MTTTALGVTFRPTWFSRDTFGGSVGFCTDEGVPERRQRLAAAGAEISVQAGYVIAFIDRTTLERLHSSV